MEPSRRASMGSMGNNGNATATGPANTSAAVIELLLPTSMQPVAVTNIAKATSLCHGDGHRVPPQHCGNSGNAVQHHQYTPLLVSGPPPLIRSSLIHPPGSLLPASPQLMLSTTAATAGEVIPRYQQHTGGSHQLVTVTTSTVPANPVAMPNSNISTVGMALSPFGILPHERVVPQHTHHRHQPRKLPTNQQSPKHLMETNITNNAQILAPSTTNPQRFYAEPSTHPTNKIKQYENIQQQQLHRVKTANGISDKSLPVVSTGYTPQPYEQRYQSRTASQQVGYLSVITRTAVTTANGAIMDDITANNNYYQAQALPLQSKTPDNHDRQYYQFDGTVSASQTPHQQVDNMLLMGTPVQRGDPMHIVKNLQSIQTDVDCYGVKKIIEQQPRLLATENSKTVGPTALLASTNKCIIENQLQHLQQTPKSTVIDPPSSYNSQYFNRRQPPPAHLHQHNNQPHIQQHLVTGNSKMLPTPTPLAVVSANGNTYLDIQQHQRHNRWNLDQQKQPTVSTPSCFPGNMSTGVFQQPSLQQQQYNNTVTAFNVQPSTSSIHQQLQMSQPTHHNNFTVSSGNPTYYNTTTTIVTSNITSITTSSSPMSSYNRQHHDNQQNPNNFHDFTNNLQGANFPLNEDNRLQSLPHVIVPNIEQELGHLCDDLATANSVIIKPLNTITKKPSFIDSYIKFLHGGTNNSTVDTEEEFCEKPKKLLRPLPPPHKPIPKPYIPLQKSKAAVSVSEPTVSRNGSSEDVRQITNVVTSKDDDPRYFPLPKLSSSIAAEISDDSNAENIWSGDDDQDQWWNSCSSKSLNAAKKAQTNTDKKKNKNKNDRKKSTNSVTTTKKQKTQHEQQPRRQLSHRLAKDKTQQLLSNIKGDLEDDELLSDADSDVDPAWIPSNDDNDAPKNSTLFLNRRHFSHKKFSKDQCLQDSPSTSSLINNNNNNNDQIDDSTLAMPFKSGSFVAHKNNYSKSNYAIPQLIWRVDGKSLLQKFQRCDNSNLFKSASTYTGWGPSHYNLYQQVSIQFVKPLGGINIIPSKPTSEIVVKYLNSGDTNFAQSSSDTKKDVSSSGQNHCSSSKVDTLSSVSTLSIDENMLKLRGNFDVYIQTLASQALDSNFLGAIYRENDDFFLSNVLAIETFTQTCVQAIDSAIVQDSKTNMSNIENVRTIITKYPDLEMCSVDNIAVDNVQLHCIICGCQGMIEKQQKFIEINLSGSEYDRRTLQNVNYNDAYSKVMASKKVYSCFNADCTDKFLILHSLEHLKYYIYKECYKRVTAESDNSSNKLIQDRTTVLNQLLADDEWISKLFHTVCNTWSKANKFVSNRDSDRKAPL